MYVNDIFLFPCAYKSLFGIDCPICGFQRSLLYLIEGRFTDSFHMYPPLIPFLIFLGLLGFHLINKNFISRKWIERSGAGLLVIIFTSYFIKLFI